MKILISHIKELVQVRERCSTPLRGEQMSLLPTLKNAWLSIENGIISGYGSMDSCPTTSTFDKAINATGKMVFPGWCDSHTHIVYAGSREQEFVDRINGLSYEDIAKRGGGILNSAQKLRAASEDELFESAHQRLMEVVKLGTAAIEIKSGYGLTLENELKMLRVIRRLKEHSPIPIKATFLGAHAFPAEYKENKSAYVDLVVNEMIPAVAKEKLADYVDVFCEVNYFSVEDTLRIMQAGNKQGLKSKIHVNQFNVLGGVKAAVDSGALSVDHLEYVSDEDIASLKNSSTIATILPSCSFFINIPYGPAKRMIEEGVAVAFATDFNPGSTPSGNMNLVVSLACIKQKLNPEQAINAATINGAFAMELSEKVGSIEVGKLGNIFITKEIPSYAFLPYYFGNSVIETVIAGGGIV